MDAHDETLAGTTGGGRIDFGTLLRALDIDVEETAGSPTSTHAPTDGRVAEDTTTGTIYVGDGSEWLDANTRSGLDIGQVDSLKFVSQPSDLPAASGGVRTLRDNTAYYFTDYIADSATLRMGDPSPLLSPHGGIGGYIHTGGTTAFQTDGEPFFADNFYGHAPGGTLFDLTAPNDVRMYVTDSAFFDPDGLFGDIGSLGTIDGYRVQTFKSVNFENFAGGLTLTGPTDKTVFTTCPFRGVTQSGVTILQWDANYQGDIAKLTASCFFKDVQADTECIRVDSGGEPSLYFKYVDVDHDATVTKSNILTGVASEDTVGFLVRDAFPLPSSSVLGELYLDPGSPVTQTGSGSGTTIDQGPYTIDTANRVTSPSAGLLQYEAKYDHDVAADADIVVQGANTTFQVAIELNGTVLERTRRDDSTSGSSKPTTVRTDTVIEDMTSDTPDQVSIYLENTGGTSDLDVAGLDLRLREI